MFQKGLQGLGRCSPLYTRGNAHKPPTGAHAHVSLPPEWPQTPQVPQEQGGQPVGQLGGFSRPAACSQPDRRTVGGPHTCDERS